jgi:hypothetical protein
MPEPFTLLALTVEFIILIVPTIEKSFVELPLPIPQPSDELEAVIVEPTIAIVPTVELPFPLTLPPPIPEPDDKLRASIIEFVIAISPIAQPPPLTEPPPIPEPRKLLAFTVELSITIDPIFDSRITLDPT